MIVFRGNQVVEEITLLDKIRARSTEGVEKKNGQA